MWIKISVMDNFNNSSKKITRLQQNENIGKRITSFNNSILLFLDSLREVHVNKDTNEMKTHSIPMKFDYKIIKIKSKRNSTEKTRWF